MKKLFMHACVAFAKVGTFCVQFDVIKNRMQNRLNGNDGMVVNNNALLDFISSSQLYRVSIMNRYPQKMGLLFM